MQGSDNLEDRRPVHPFGDNGQSPNRADKNDMQSYVNRVNKGDSQGASNTTILEKMRKGR